MQASGGRPPGVACAGQKQTLMERHSLINLLFALPPNLDTTTVSVALGWSFQWGSYTSRLLVVMKHGLAWLCAGHVWFLMSNSFYHSTSTLMSWCALLCVYSNSVLVYCS